MAHPCFTFPMSLTQKGMTVFVIISQDEMRKRRNVLSATVSSTAKGSKPSAFTCPSKANCSKLTNKVSNKQPQPSLSS